MDKDLGQTSGPARTNFTPYTFSKVNDTRPDDEPPTQITKAVLRGIEWEARDVVRVDGITDETTSGVGVETEHEEECKVVSIPKGFKALVSDLLVGSRVHYNHDQEHKVACDATRLGVVDLEGGLLANFLGKLDNCEQHDTKWAYECARR